MPQSPVMVSLGNVSASDPRYRADADAVLRPLRGCPFHEDALCEDVLVIGYEAARAILVDRNTSRDFQIEMGGRASSLEVAVMRLDEPDHSRIRKPMLTTLTARTKRYADVIARHAASLLADIADDEPFDAVARFSQPLSAEIVATLMGVHPTQRTAMIEWMIDISLMFELSLDDEQAARFQKGFASLTVFLRKSAESRRLKLVDDWISDLVRDSDMTDIEIMLNMRITIIASVLPISALISNALRLLVANPAELAKLRADPSLIDSAIEEVLRFEPPVEATSRGSHHGVELAGTPIGEFREIEVLIRAVNHDPEVFDDPDTFSIDAERRAHLSFGAGSRMCIGAAFSRQAAVIGVAAFVERFGRLSLADPEAAPSWRITPAVRILESLPLVGNR